MDIDMRGMEGTQRKLEQVVQDLRGGPILNAMRRATLIVQRAAKLNLKPWRGPGTGGVDTGTLRASIVPEIRQKSDVIMGVVGSNLHYAPYQELGFSPHYVPADIIGRWAERHGLGYRGIYVAGRALRFLQRAFEENVRQMFEPFARAVNTIVRK